MRPGGGEKMWVRGGGGNGLPMQAGAKERGWW